MNDVYTVPAYHMIRRDDIDNLSYFRHRESPLNVKRLSVSLKEKTLDLIKTILREIAYLFTRIVRYFRGDQKWVNSQSKVDGKRLVVCLHGLSNNPGQFRKLVKETNKLKSDDTSFYVPKVLKKGNARLDDMVKPIFDEIVRWAKSDGEKELVLVGISNGGRIIRAVEAELAKTQSCGNIKKIKSISIVGANKGTSLVNVVNKVGLSCLLPKAISEEMSLNSKRSQQLEEDLKEGLAKTPETQVIRNYTYIAAEVDHNVPDFTSTLPIMKCRLDRKIDVRYALLKGFGHNSIVDRVATSVAQMITSKQIC